jgi:molybdate transport repressor ModE-like protein
VDLEIRHFRLLVAVADSGSISGAARRLGLAQPSVSTQLRRIERTVGRPLFVRRGSGVAATAAGTSLVRRARVLLRDVARVAAVGTEADTPPPVRIGLSGLPVPEVATGLAARSPSRSWVLRVLSGSPRTALDESAVDALLLAHHMHAPLPAPDGTTVRDAVTTEFRVLVPVQPKHPDEPVDLGEFATERWVVPADDRMRAFVLGECRAAGFEPDVGFVVDDTSTLLRLVAAGRAVGLAAPVGDLPRGVAGLTYQEASLVRWAVVHGPDLAPDVADELVEVVTRLLDPTLDPPPSGAVTGPVSDASPRTLRVGSMFGRPDAQLPTLLVEEYAVTAEHRTGDAPDLLQQLGRGALDLVVRHDYAVDAGRAPRPGSVAVEVEPLMLAMTMLHPLGVRPSVPLTDLDGQRVLLRADRPVGEVEPHRALLAAAGARPGELVPWDAEDLLHGLLWATGGVALVGTAVVDPTIRLVPVDHPLAHRRVTLVAGPDGRSAALAPVVAAAHADLLARFAHPAVRHRLRRT